MNLTPDQVRCILDIPAGEPVVNAAAFMVRWQRMVLGREYGELTIRIQAGREAGWTEHVTHREGTA
jgi:hypothetical protein